MIRRLTLLLALVAVLHTGLLSHAHAASDKGLLITPLRQHLSADAGKSMDSKITIANLTSATLDVDLSVQQFSVTNYTYDYRFSPPAEDWLRLSVASVILQPRQTREIPYTITVPAGSKPGGQYYTIMAGSTITTGGVTSTIQAADLIYLTVNGALTRTSKLQKSSMPWISFGRSIPYDLQPVNTGNVHFFAYTTGQLHGLFTRPAATSGTHLLMPGKPYDMHGSIPSPILPGLYEASYGYKTDGGKTVMRTQWVLYIPPWFIAVLLGSLLIAGKFWVRKRRPQPKDPVSS